jgi:hypothetical protein
MSRPARQPSDGPGGAGAPACGSASQRSPILRLDRKRVSQDKGAGVFPAPERVQSGRETIHPGWDKNGVWTVNETRNRYFIVIMEETVALASG